MSATQKHIARTLDNEEVRAAIEFSQEHALPKYCKNLVKGSNITLSADIT